MNTLLTSGSTAVEIAESIERAIRAQEIVTGQLLPAVRLLASQLQVSPNTVAAAYKLLRNAGWVDTDGRRGTRVAEQGVTQVARHALPGHLRNAASGNVDGRLLPRLNGDWLAQWPADTGHDLQGDDPGLLEVARQWLLEQAVPGEHIGVFHGAMDAMEKALRAHCRPGNRVLVEDPCWPPVLALLANLRLKPVALRADELGACPPGTDPLREVAAVILTPRAQNPTGHSFSSARWQAWSIALQDAADTLLILDDHWGPLSQAEPPLLAPLPARWVHITSVSKFLGPDLRLSVVAANAHLLADMQRLQAVASRWVSHLLQRIAARLWQAAITDGQLQRAAMSYAQRRSTLIQALNAQSVTCEPSAEGLHLWIGVADETSAVQALASYGWAVQAGKPFRLGEGAQIRVSIANLDMDDLPGLAKDVSKALRVSHKPVY
ncbi:MULTISPECIES: aminotransferase class I/II-fold pyridoxal phosphate-dependent enzyme [unclassified Pseudomonas]|uniref:aminotransferase class I/II-fold pyridoxal phosphate-dependent enzyme n=1 Tax=unclassified Pseudomonas TaxID=196821 RepID=UPI0002E5C628|nr:aminotransferase class I/II-fold pyridoxal phosphate-dependent enzyme [Pseudomonas sp. M47T1]